MANITIWNDLPGPISGSTPFGFYDNDTQYQLDGPKIARFCARRLGYPLVDIELDSGSFYTCFEEAVTTYGNEIYKYKVVENYINLEGASTGSVLNNMLVQPNLGSMISIAQQYGTEAGSGGNVNYYTGSVNLLPGVQMYDLKAWAQSQNITGSIEIKRIFHEAPPAITRYFDPYAGTGTGVQSLMDSFGFGAYSPGVNFMLMPIYFDIQKLQAIELNDQIRKSAYTFELINNQLRVFPIPINAEPLWFHFLIKEERINPNGGNNNGGLITNASNVPYNNPTYAQINSVGRQWIYAYTLALAKESLAYVRGKYQTVPIPGSETTLNQSDLINSSNSEKESLLEKLRLMLDEISRKSQLERKKMESEYTRETLTNVPMVIYIG